MALIQYSFRSEVLKENTEIYVILPTYEVFRDPEKKGAETYYKEYERKKTLFHVDRNMSKCLYRIRVE